MEGPSSSTLNEIQEQLNELNRLAFDELRKGAGHDKDLVARYERRVENLLAQMKLMPSGEVLLKGQPPSAPTDTVCKLDKACYLVRVGGGRADLLLSEEALDKVFCSIFLVLDQDGDCVGGGFFYAPGKAVTADHNLLPEQGIGNTMLIRTTKATIPVLIRDRNTPYDYALLECGSDVQKDHLVVSSHAEVLMGRALTLCAFQIGLRKDLPEWGKGADIDMGLLQARGCKLSKQKHHLLYDVSSLPGDSGCALVLYDGQVVGMHLAAANTLVDNLDRAKELDAQMNEVAESIASFTASTAQLGIALLCHVFTK